HGAPPVVVRVQAALGFARLEVTDASPRWPVIAPPSTSNMTGRGFALVDSVSSNWGVGSEADVGKTVWCEFSSDGDTRRATLDVGALLAGNDAHPDADRQFRKVLDDVPTALLIEANPHVAKLVRE